MVNSNQNVNEIITKLMDVVKLKENDDDELIQLLDYLIEVLAKENSNEQSITIDNEFINFLSHKSNLIVAKTAKIVAEIAKTEEGRKVCTQNELIRNLINLLGRDDSDILIQTCRALGNICYENDAGNKMVQDNDGLKCILEIFKKIIEFNNEKLKTDLASVVTGFLLNFLDDQSSLQNEAVVHGLINILSEILKMEETNDTKTTMHILLILETLNDSKISFLDEKMTNVLVNMLKNTSNESLELSQMILEILQGQAENDNAKVLLGKSGVCEFAINLFEKHGSECINDDTRELVKLACNLIVLILAGDESMNLLYCSGDGFVYKKLVEWLDKDMENDDKDLQIGAVLAMGNFARTDKHCELMVSQNVHKKLYKLLINVNNSENIDVRSQYAILSALRNLVIPINNKPIMLSDGLIDVLQSMINTSSFIVAFKLIGTFRIVIDKQKNDATLLGNNNDIIKRIIEWCDADDHPDVVSEANRLIAWIIINSTDKQVVNHLIKHGAIKYLVKMINSTHPIMQNEAILSLTIATNMNLELCQDHLIEANIAQSIITFYENPLPNLQISIVDNSLTFLTVMVKSDALKEHLNKPELVINIFHSTWKASLYSKTVTFLNLLTP